MAEEEGCNIPNVLETTSVETGNIVIIHPLGSKEGDILVQMVKDRLSLSSLEEGIGYWWQGETGLNLFSIKDEQVKWIY